MQCNELWVPGASNWKYKMLSYCRETALQVALVLAKCGKLELADNILRTLYNHCDIIGMQSYRIRWEKRQIRAFTPFKVILGHRGRY